MTTLTIEKKKRQSYNVINPRKGFNSYGVKRCENPSGLCLATIYEDSYLISGGKYCSEECLSDGRSARSKKNHANRKLR